jgi:hypothetical protein
MARDNGGFQASWWKSATAVDARIAVDSAIVIDSPTKA